MENQANEYFETHRVHNLVDEMLHAAVDAKPEDLKNFWRDWLGDRLREELSFKAVIFDLDGCITKTASVHSRAWKAMFDAYLKDRDGEGFKEFTTKDYLDHVDGRPRYEGVETFLSSRGIDIDRGDPSDKPNQENITCCSLGNRKNDFFLSVLETEGVEVYPSSVRIMQTCRSLGIRLGLASSSKNALSVLEKAGLTHLIESRIDGVVSAERGLKGKPAGDIFVTACTELGVSPSEAIVIEDAVSGVAAGRHGNFRLVIGLARENNREELEKHGAHVVLEDFGAVTLKKINDWFLAQPVP
eukprot:TRINITY_DN2985_c1_g2_i1.p1 TRINITY_DN2985_c1_g2~~TRINITY_DN2985_c1_g2_i1.p1  ORF type:complete len:316 (+),score=73.62 TRINITY_DN2985_c1_g2_i1:50-949(+)